MQSIIKKISIGIIGLMAICIIGFFIYVQIYYKAGDLATEQLQSSDTVEVEENGNIVFEPKTNRKDVGFIFYPGAKVEASAYAPLAKKIAENGYRVVIADLRFNLAILSPNKAKDIIAQYDDIDSWVIGGHSLGGVMAANYVQKDEKIKGLILLASYPQDKANLQNESIEVASIWGSNDEVASHEKITAAKDLLPTDAQFIEIQGGNHAGFGDYGEQKGDGKATITIEQQITESVQFILNVLERVNSK